jgi:hypothetical protein
MMIGIFELKLADVEQFNSNIERFRNQIMEIIEEDNVNEKQAQRGNGKILKIKIIKFMREFD